MIIMEGSAKHIHSWFLTEKTDEVVLCVLLGSGPSDVVELSRLIDNAVHVDALVGRKIGFLLCSGDLQASSCINRSGGARFILNAQYVRARAEPLAARNFISHFDIEHLRHGPSEYYSRASAALARSTARLVPEFMGLFGVDRTELPCVVTLFKGLETFNVAKLPSDWSNDILLEWLSNIGEVLEKVERELLLRDSPVWEIEFRVKRAAECYRELDAKLKKIRHSTIGICNKYVRDQAYSLPLVSSLASQDLEKAAKLQIIEAMFESYPASKSDNRWPSIMSLIDQTEKLNALALNVLDRASAQSLSDWLTDELNKFKAISDDISSLRIGKVRSRVGSRLAIGSGWKGIERANTAADITERIYQIIQLLSRLLP